MKPINIAAALVAALPTLSTGQQIPELPPLPEGRWTGTITNRTIPDVDKDGEWKQHISLVHCQGKAAIQFRREDGTLEPALQVSAVPFQRMFILLYLNAEKPDLGGWVESQIWTLVDARPNGWTLGQSRAVLNQDKKPDDPWFTFRRFAWGTVEHDAKWCEQGR